MRSEIASESLRCALLVSFPEYALQTDDLDKTLLFAKPSPASASSLSRAASGDGKQGADVDAEWDAFARAEEQEQLLSRIAKAAALHAQGRRPNIALSRAESSAASPASLRRSHLQLGLSAYTPQARAWFDGELADDEFSLYSHSHSHSHAPHSTAAAVRVREIGRAHV